MTASYSYPPGTYDGIEDYVRITFGPPGTGKTTYLKEQVDKTVQYYGSRGALVCSLTRAAAAEIGHRNETLHRDMIGTLHGHCYRAMGAPEIAESHHDEFTAKHAQWKFHDLDSRSQRRAKSKSSSDEDDFDSEIEQSIGRHMGADELYQKVQRYRARMVPANLWPPEVREFVTAWDAWKAANQYLDFTDLIEVSLHEISSPPGNPHHVYVDEGQDHSALELALLCKWGRACSGLVVVHDPDQAIYAWRGADPWFFLRAAKYGHAVPEEHKRVLEQSYRCPVAIHAVAQRCLAGITEREPVVWLPRDAAGQVATIAGESRDRDAEVVHRAIAEWEAGRTVMIEAACAYMLDPLIRQMRAAGVPFANPWRRRQGAWNPLPRRKNAVSAAMRVAAFLEVGDVGQQTQANLHRWVDCVAGEHLRHGAKAEIKRAAKDDPGKLLRGSDIITSLFSESLQAEASAALASGNLGWLVGHATKEASASLAYPTAIAEQRGGAKALARDPGIYVGTIHSFKGAEADVVICYQDTSPAGWRNPSAARAATARQAYVAATRARETLLLVPRRVGQHGMDEFMSP